MENEGASARVRRPEGRYRFGSARRWRPGDSILSPARAGEAQIRGRRGRVRRCQAETRAGGACLPSLDPALARPDPAAVSSAPAPPRRARRGPPHVGSVVREAGSVGAGGRRRRRVRSGRRLVGRGGGGEGRLSLRAIPLPATGLAGLCSVSLNEDHTNEDDAGPM